MRFVQKGVHKASSLCYDRLTSEAARRRNTRTGILGGNSALAIQVGINGFGRIGRVVLRIMMERPETFDICGINLRKADVDYMVYMIKYDSVFRQFTGTVEREDQDLIVNGHRIRVFSEADAARIPW